MTFYLTHRIEFAGDGWQPVTDSSRVAAIMDNSRVGWAAENTSADEIMLELSINVDSDHINRNRSLRPLGGYSRNRFRITTYVYVQRGSQMPGWLSRYGYVGNPALISDPTVFGYYTISLQSILSRLAQWAGDYDEPYSVAANILVYVIVDQ